MGTIETEQRLALICGKCREAGYSEDEISRSEQGGLRMNLLLSASDARDLGKIDDERLGAFKDLCLNYCPHFQNDLDYSVQ